MWKTRLEIVMDLAAALSFNSCTDVFREQTIECHLPDILTAVLEHDAWCRLPLADQDHHRQHLPIPNVPNEPKIHKINTNEFVTFAPTHGIFCNIFSAFFLRRRSERTHFSATGCFQWSSVFVLNHISSQSMVWMRANPHCECWIEIYLNVPQ